MNPESNTGKIARLSTYTNLQQPMKKSFLFIDTKFCKNDNSLEQLKTTYNKEVSG